MWFTVKNEKNIKYPNPMLRYQNNHLTVRDRQSKYLLTGSFTVQQEKAKPNIFRIDTYIP